MVSDNKSIQENLATTYRTKVYFSTDITSKRSFVFPKKLSWLWEIINVTFKSIMKPSKLLMKGHYDFNKVIVDNTLLKQINKKQTKNCASLVSDSLEDMAPLYCLAF